MSFVSGRFFPLCLTWGLFVALAAASTTTTTTTTSSKGFLATTITTTGTSTTTTTTVKGPSFVATDFVKYVGSDTKFNVNGSVYFEQIFSNSGVPGQSLTWDLGDVDPACKTGSGNQCGIHIHVGTNCSKDAEGDFWNKTLADTNPWTAVQYNTEDELSQSNDGIKVITGIKSEDIVGHAVIVYDSVAPGNRIACALITEVTTTTTTTTSTTLPSGTSWWPLVAIGVISFGVAIVACLMFCTSIFSCAKELEEDEDES